MSVRARVRAHRARLQAEGLRPVQIWVPGMRSPKFAPLRPIVSRCWWRRRRRPTGIRSLSRPSRLTKSDPRRDLDRGSRVGGCRQASAGGRYPGRPVRCDRFDATDSVTICAFTTDPTEAPLFRLLIAPSPQNGLGDVSSLMVDKITTIPANQARRTNRAAVQRGHGRAGPRHRRVPRACRVLRGRRPTTGSAGPAAGRSSNSDNAPPPPTAGYKGRGPLFVRAGKADAGMPGIPAVAMAPSTDRRSAR